MGIKISELNPLETPADGDIIPIVDMDAGETKYIEFADLLGPEGPAGPAGADGEEVTIRVDGGYIQWRLGDGEWENLIAVSSLVGPQGEQGIQGPEGPAATLNWMGAWSALTEYDPLDVVSHEGVTYLCIATSTDDEPPDPVHWNAIGAVSLDADLFNRLASLLNDTVAKGAPRAQDTPDMTIYVAGFQAYINGALVSFPGGNSAAMVAPTANPRIDRVYLTDAGALAISTGAEDASPTAPALVAGTVPICLVYHRVGSVHIDDADDSTNSYIYRDDRPLYQDVTPRIWGPYAFDHADSSPVTLFEIPARSRVMRVYVESTETDAGGVDWEIGVAADTDLFVTDIEMPSTDDDIVDVEAAPKGAVGVFFSSATNAILTISTAGTAGAGRVWFELVTLPTS